MSKLRQINVNEHIEKKGQFSYLSWAFAVDKLIEAYPDAEWEVHHYPMMVAEREVVGLSEDNEPVTITNMRAVPEIEVPYMRTDTGYYVEVTVTIRGIARTQVHPVLDNRNQPISQPSSFQINTSIQRCLAKAIALHGLSLYIYAGEDLPPEENGQVTGEKMDVEHAQDMAEAIRQAIDEDGEDAPDIIRMAWGTLNSDEQLKVHALLGNEKAKDSNRMYRTLIKDYLGANDE